MENYNNQDSLNMEQPKFISDITGGIIKKETAAPENISQKISTSIGNISSSILTIKMIASKFFALAEGTETIVNLIEKYPKVTKYLEPLAKSIDEFDTQGQLDPNTKNRFKKLSEVLATTTPSAELATTNKSSIIFPASFALGFVLAKADGASDGDAFIQGTILAVMDAHSKLSGSKIGDHAITGKEVEGIFKSENINLDKIFSPEEVKSPLNEQKGGTTPLESRKNTMPQESHKDATPQETLNPAINQSDLVDSIIAKITSENK